MNRSCGNGQGMRSGGRVRPKYQWGDSGHRGTRCRRGRKPVDKKVGTVYNICRIVLQRVAVRVQLERL